MTSREHYQRGLGLLKEVEDLEREIGEQKFEPDLAMVVNANMMRILKKAELHFMAANLKVTYER